jgi:nucleoside-diphosphate-sugar epimerase
MLKRRKTEQTSLEMPMKTVLVVGMSGLMGNAVRRQLSGKYELVALNRRKVEGVRSRQADIRNLDGILSAFKGIDTVVHLAGVFKGKLTWKDYLENNVVGTYNVFEASKIAGVRRIVFASSGAVVAGWEKVPPYDSIVQGRYDAVAQQWAMLTHEAPLKPGGIYGATKVWGEVLGRVYSDMYGISVICLRIGVVNAEDRPTEPRHFAVWCSQRDLAGMVERCIEAPPDVKYDIFYVNSSNKWGFRDLEHARKVLGFVPQDSADTFAGNPQSPPR